MSASWSNDVEKAKQNATDTLTSIANSKGWSATQKATALNGVQRAYENATSLLSVVSSFAENLSFSSFIENAITGGQYMDSVTNAEVAKEFWEQLAAISKEWSGFPNYSDVQSWVKSALTASGSALEYEVAQSNVEVVKQGTIDTAKDYSDIAKAGADAAADPKTWYAIAAAALIGATIYLRVVLR